MLEARSVFLAFRYMYQHAHALPHSFQSSFITDTFASVQRPELPTRKAETPIKSCR